MAKKKTYYDHLREELGELLDKLQIDSFQKTTLKRRWLDQVVWADKKADECRRLHYRLRLTTIIGGVILPALVGVNMQLDKNNDASRWFPYVPFVLSQVIAVSVALDEFGRYGDRWSNYRKMAEDLKAEGWQYLQLNGTYELLSSHQDGYARFAEQVENVISQDVKSYIAALQEKQIKEQGQVQGILAIASEVAQDKTLFARPQLVVEPSALESTLVLESAPVPMGTAGTLQVIESTVFKLDTQPANLLPDTHKFSVATGRTFGLEGQIPAANGHLKVTLTETLGAVSYDTWFVYGSHGKITDANGAIFSNEPIAPPPAPPAAPAEIPITPSTPSTPLKSGAAPIAVANLGTFKLPVPYFSQRDNEEQAERTCNTSSCAMVAKFLGAKIKGDDDYFQHVKQHGDTTDHSVQTEALIDIGIKSTWHTDLDFEDLDKSLASGLPIVIGIYHRGTLENPGGGHMVVVIGRTADGNYIVNDPYGSVMDDYDTDLGEGVVYPRHVLVARWITNEPRSGWGRLFYENSSPAHTAANLGSVPSATVATTPAATSRSTVGAVASLTPVLSSGSASGLARLTSIVTAAATPMPSLQTLQMITIEQLIKIAPTASENRLKELTPAINQTLERFQINKPLRIAHFIAQVAHESGAFVYMRELWGPTEDQEFYEGRLDLGNTQPGDGKRFMGRGLMQLTGRANYEKFSAAMKVDFTKEPDLVAQAPYAVLVAGWFWDNEMLNSHADKDDINTITRRINGGYNGLEDRKEYLQRAKSVLQC